MIRPPFGLRPEFVHEEFANMDRVREILAAIERYADASTDVPQRWIDELQRRVDFGAK